MQRRVVLLTILSSIIVMAAIACAPVNLHELNRSVKKEAQFPNPKPGSRWLLKALDGSWTAQFELKRVENGKFIVLLNGRETEYTNEWNALENVVDQRTIRAKFSPHDYSFSFPLWEGKRWGGIVSWTGRAALMTQDTFSVSGEAKGWEKIEVEAGSFEAIKVIIQTEKILVICWYAPEAQLTVKCVSPTHPRRSWELGEFHLAER